MTGKSIKAKTYIKKNKFEKTRDYLKLNFKSTEYSISFRWVHRTRCEYKFDTRVTIAVNRVKKRLSRTMSLLL